MTDTLVDDLIAAPPVADVAVVPYHQNSTYVLLVVEPKHGERVEYRISVGAADVLFHELAGMSGLEVVETDPSKAFAAWCEQGPKLAKAAGLYVGIKVMPGSADPSRTKAPPMVEDRGVTGLPWHVVRANSGTVVSGAGGDRDFVAMQIAGQTVAQKRANAAYIVKACNAYPGLVALAREISSQFNPADYREGSMERRLGDKAREALASLSPPVTE